MACNGGRFWPGSLASLGKAPPLSHAPRPVRCIMHGQGWIRCQIYRRTCRVGAKPFNLPHCGYVAIALRSRFQGCPTVTIYGLMFSSWHGAGGLVGVAMDARPNRYEELTGVQRARVDRLINAVAAGRLELPSDVCPSAAPVCRPCDLAWAVRR